MAFPRRFPAKLREDILNFSTNASYTEPTPTVSASEGTLMDIVMDRLAMTLNVYYTPVLIVLGCLGNIISILVFFKSKLRLQSTSQYLSALALSDTLFLCQLLPPWLKALGASTVFTRDGYCQLFVYLSYMTSNLSAWLVVSFTVERFVAVVYPLRRNSVCSVKRARYIIGTLTVIALLLNAPVLRFAVPSGNDCNVDELLITHAARFNIVDTALSFTAPLAVILVVNIWIAMCICRVSHTRPDLLREHPDTARTPQMARLSARRRSQQRVTRMLLIVSSVFVVLNLPAYTMRIVAYANDMSEREYSGKWAALQQVCLMFFNTNFGINFTLYCLTGQNFRRAMLETFPFLRRHQQGNQLHGIVSDPPARASSASPSQSCSNPDGPCTLNSGVNVAERSSVCQADSGLGERRCRSSFVRQSGERRLRRNFARQNESPLAIRHRGRCVRRNFARQIDNQLTARSGAARNIEMQNKSTAPVRRRYPSQKVIQRWKFNNPRRESFNKHNLQPSDVSRLANTSAFSYRSRYSVPQVHCELHCGPRCGHETIASTWI